MTIINQKSISGITSITFASAGDDLLTFHSNNGTERFRIDNSGSTKITAGIVTTLTVTGASTLNNNVTFTGTNYNATWNKSDSELEFADNAKATFGTGGDLLIYHDGDNSFIKDAGTGRLTIAASQLQLTNAADSEVMIKATQDDAVELYHNGSKKLETKSDGVDITGELQCDTLDVDGNIDLDSKITFDSGGNVLDFIDNVAARFGTGNDLQVYHDGSNSRIKNTTGSLWLQSDTGIRFTDAGVNESMAAFYDNGAVELYYDGSKKFETLTNGTQTTGRVYLNGTNGGLDYNNTAHTLEYLVNGSTHSELNTGAYLPATNGGKNLGASNKRWGTVYTNGILFNGDTADANSLDDYEEGTWTPVYAGGSSAGSYSPGTTAGFYTKVGRKVYVTASLLNIVTNSAGSGELRITGLPFTPNNDAGASSNIGTVMLDNFNVNNNAIHLCSFTSPNQTYITIREIVDGGADSTMAVTDKDSDGSDLVINCTYIV